MNSTSTNLEQHSSTHRETPETQQREQPLLPRRRRLFFAARDTLAATLAAEKEIARLMSPPKGGRARARDEREEMEGGNARETERERERRGDAASVELQFRAGWSVAAATTTLPLPPFVCVLRLNVTIITGKAVHTHAGNRGGTRNYIDISIASPDGLIN